jgi:hypothetical protein
MSLEQDKVRFVHLLRKNPRQAAPALPDSKLTVARFESL